MKATTVELNNELTLELNEDGALYIPQQAIYVAPAELAKVVKSLKHSNGSIVINKDSALENKHIGKFALDLESDYSGRLIRDEGWELYLENDDVIINIDGNDSNIVIFTGKTKPTTKQLKAFRRPKTLSNHINGYDVNFYPGFIRLGCQTIENTAVEAAAKAFLTTTTKKKKK